MLVPPDIADSIERSSFVRDGLNLISNVYFHDFVKRVRPQVNDRSKENRKIKIDTVEPFVMSKLSLSE